MTTTTKVKSFIKQFVSTVKGDDVEAQAQKVLRHADSALKSHIAALEGDTIALEDKLEAAKEKQLLARINNGNNFADRNAYVKGLLNAKNNVIEAEEALELHKKTVEFLKSELKALDEEVEG